MLDLTDQLRRYADAADARAGEVDPTPIHPAAKRVPSSSRRRVLAAAAAVAVIAGTGILFANRNRSEIITTPADLADGECPSPRDDGAHVGDLRLALPWATSADLTLSTEDRVTYVLDRGGSREVHLTLADFGSEPTDPATKLPNGFPRTTVSLCDPFGGSTPTELPAAVIAPGESLAPGASLQFHPGGRWTVGMYAGQQSEVTVEDLGRIAAGMSWPAPAAPANTCDSLSGSGTESLTVTALPADYQPESPASTVVPAGATAAAEQYFRRDDGHTISVLWFSADDPASVIRTATGDLTDDRAEQQGIPGCLQVSGASSGWRHGEVQVLVRRVPDGVIVAGQFGTGDGWVVTGGAETTTAEVLSVASGLRP
jgi:hypothetical protein